MAEEGLILGSIPAGPTCGHFCTGAVPTDTCNWFYRTKLSAGAPHRTPGSRAVIRWFATARNPSILTGDAYRGEVC